MPIHSTGARRVPLPTCRSRSPVESVRTGYRRTTSAFYRLNVAVTLLAVRSTEGGIECWEPTTSRSRN
jgi:hypothetical protein